MVLWLTACTACSMLIGMSAGGAHTPFYSFLFIAMTRPDAPALGTNATLRTSSIRHARKCVAQSQCGRAPVCASYARSCGPGPYCYNTSSSQQVETMLPPAATLCEAAGCAYWSGSGLPASGSSGTDPGSAAGGIGAVDALFAGGGAGGNSSGGPIVSCLPRSYAAANSTVLAQLEAALRGLDFGTVGNCTGTRFYAAVVELLGKRTLFDECDTRAARQLAFYEGDKARCSFDPENAAATRDDPLYASYVAVNEDCRAIQETLSCEWTGQEDLETFPDVPYFVADLGVAEQVMLEFTFPELSSGARSGRGVHVRLGGRALAWAWCCAAAALLTRALVDFAWQ